MKDHTTSSSAGEEVEINGHGFFIRYSARKDYELGRLYITHKFCEFWLRGAHKFVDVARLPIDTHYAILDYVEEKIQWEW